MLRTQLFSLQMLTAFVLGVAWCHVKLRHRTTNEKDILCRVPHLPAHRVTGASPDKVSNGCPGREYAMLA